MIGQLNIYGEDKVTTAKNGFEELNRDGYIDDVDLDGIAEEIAAEIQKGVLNVLDTYIMDLKNEYQK